MQERHVNASKQKGKASPRSRGSRSNIGSLTIGAKMSALVEG